MMSPENIINVSEADFEYEVLNYSESTPVMVDFWAAWCIPCRTLDPLLEKLVKEAQGALRLAKLDVDANPNLARQFNIRSVPAVKVFAGGQIVAEFTGLVSEQALRTMIRNLTPSPNDLLLEKASSLLKLHQWQSAEEAFREFLQTNPDLPAAQLGLAKAMLAQSRAREALLVLYAFPASREFAVAETLRPLADALVNMQRGAFEGDDNLDAALQNCLRLFKRGLFEPALDGLIDILRQNKRYRNGLARQCVVAILELLGDEDPTARQYRQELASVLF